jgi:spore germination protein KC
LTAQIVVAKGATARDLLQAEFSDTAMPSESAQKIMLYLHSTRGTIPEITLREFQDRVESEGIEPIALGAELTRLEPDISIEGELTRKEIKSTARLGGTAIFKGNYLVGWLDDLETRGLNWVLGKVKGAQVVFPQPGFEDKLATVEILRSSSKFKVEVQEGKIRANVEIDTVGNLGCVQEPVDLVQQPEIWTQLEKGLEKAIKDEVMHTAAKLQQIGADAIGFGQNIFRRKPKEWAKLKDQWDEMFPTVEVHVKVKASLRTTGMVMKSIETK